MFNNKVIMLTGGTGSFGNKFVELILNKYKPKKLIIYSRDEYKQFLMQKKFDEKKNNFLRFFLGDVRDLDRLKIISTAVHKGVVIKRIIPRAMGRSTAKNDTLTHVEVVAQEI